MHSSVTPGARMWAVLRIVCLALLLSGTISSQSSRVLRNVKVGERAPAISVVTLDGEVIDEAKLQGHRLLLVFVRPGHDKSARALEVVDRFQRTLAADSDLLVLAVSTDPEAGDHFRELVSGRALSLTITLDPGRKTYGAFGLIVAPTTLLVDAEGVLRFAIPNLFTNYERHLRIHVDLILGRISAAEHDALLARETEVRDDERASLETRIAFARTLLDDGRHDLALAVLEKIPPGSDKSIFVDTLRGEILLHFGELEEAALLLDRYANLEITPPAYKRVAARLERLRGNLERAEALLREALSVPSERARTLYELGLLYEQMGDGKKAMDCYRQALEEVFG